MKRHPSPLLMIVYGCCHHSAVSREYNWFEGYHFVVTDSIHTVAHITLYPHGGSNDEFRALVLWYSLYWCVKLFVKSIFIFRRDSLVCIIFLWFFFSITSQLHFCRLSTQFLLQSTCFVWDERCLLLLLNKLLFYFLVVYLFSYTF